MVPVLITLSDRPLAPVQGHGVFIRRISQNNAFYVSNCR